jgi:ribosomal protein S18 acetylase RimI-like enzyme
MQIRLMQKQDLPALFNLWEKAKLSTTTPNREKRECELMLQRNPTTCFVATEQTQIIGSIFGANNGRRAWIYHFAVDPNFQRKGIGKELYKTVEEALKETGVTKIIAAVAKDNLQVQPYYELLGFTLMDDAILFGKDIL